MWVESDCNRRPRKRGVRQPACTENRFLHERVSLTRRKSGLPDSSATRPPSPQAQARGRVRFTFFLTPRKLSVERAQTTEHTHSSGGSNAQPLSFRTSRRDTSMILTAASRASAAPIQDKDVSATRFLSFGPGLRRGAAPERDLESRAACAISACVLGSKLGCASEFLSPEAFPPERTRPDDVLAASTRAASGTYTRKSRTKRRPPAAEQALREAEVRQWGLKHGLPGGLSWRSLEAPAAQSFQSPTSSAAGPASRAERSGSSISIPVSRSRSPPRKPIAMLDPGGMSWNLIEHRLFADLASSPPGTVLWPPPDSTSALGKPARREGHARSRVCWVRTASLSPSMQARRRAPPHHGRSLASRKPSRKNSSRTPSSTLETSPRLRSGRGLEHAPDRAAPAGGPRPRDTRVVPNAPCP